MVHGLSGLSGLSGLIPTGLGFANEGDLAQALLVNRTIDTTGVLIDESSGGNDGQIKGSPCGTFNDAEHVEITADLDSTVTYGGTFTVFFRFKTSDTGGCIFNYSIRFK